MKAMVLHTFYDKKANKWRYKDEKFEVTEKRFKEINSGGFGDLVKEIEVKKDESNKK